MKLFIVGGFLGSGKTTAIQHAAKYLQQRKKKVGVITNDQGAQQVDTGFMKSHHIPSVEVAGGCFCCKYDELEAAILELKTNEHPHIIFAEAVGSCTDMAATVINPLLSLNDDEYEIVFSVFADIRLLAGFLQNDKTIFYDNVNYIFEKQLDEADVIVVNKVDLLDAKQLAEAKQLIQAAYADRVIIYQNSLSQDSIEQWVTLMVEAPVDKTLRRSPSINYDVYGAGEAELAWLDEELGILTAGKNAVDVAYRLIYSIHNKIISGGYPIGHVKFLIDDGHSKQKISFTTLSTTPYAHTNKSIETGRVVLLINARVQVSPAILNQLVAAAVMETELLEGCRIIEYTRSSFQPGYPKPTHRLTGR